MNPYFAFFALWAALSAPVRLRLSLRLGRRSGFGLLVRLYGLPFARMPDPKDTTGERPIQEKDVARTLGGVNWTLFKTAIRSPMRRRLYGTVRLASLELYARVAFADAGRTALCYAAGREVLRTLSLVYAGRAAVGGRVEAAFTGEGTELLARAELDARLGGLMALAAFFGFKYLRARARHAKTQTDKEDEHAAASH